MPQPWIPPNARSIDFIDRDLFMSDRAKPAELRLATPPSLPPSCIFGVVVCCRPGRRYCWFGMKKAATFLAQTRAIAGFGVAFRIIRSPAHWVTPAGIWGCVGTRDRTIKPSRDWLLVVGRRSGGGNAVVLLTFFMCVGGWLVVGGMAGIPLFSCRFSRLRFCFSPARAKRKFCAGFCAGFCAARAAFLGVDFSCPP